ncbi:hypothetical protein KIN20_024416 [Parelaphostrongylus tenuis]|uniref:Uncharacterized protein n=1 Tax=Parelaphostrongylus tenuis TaxID=148309 RepID=A0AAD5MTE4_PARTN|nr:hypothetical protein KIN20_024416 [Parelaphostrongylus tenuis]
MSDGRSSRMSQHLVSKRMYADAATSNSADNIHSQCAPQELKTTSILGHCENNISNRRFTYSTILMQNASIKQDSRTLTAQYERENIEAPVSAITTPIAQHESQAIRTSNIMWSVA